MEIRPDCVPCLMKRVLFQARLLDNGCEYDAIEAAMKTYSDLFGPGRNSAAVATEVHRSAYKAMGSRDPYLALKIEADKVAGEYMDVVTDYIDGSEDRFAAAVRVAVIGNIMDFGSGIAIDHPDQFRGQFDKLLAQGIGSDDTVRFKQAVLDADTVLYIFDNCGESQLDKFLIKEIRNMGKRVVGVVRGEPILNDVTMTDAKRIGLDKVVDRLVTTNQFAIGFDLRKVGEDLKEEMSKTGLIVAKGMANYEALSDQITGMSVVYILRTKCIPVAESLGVPTEINVVRFVPYE
ncbi:MAG: ARMT1-like domain-containing protein [Candidatus Methanomethylophilaceae archaeon]